MDIGFSMSAINMQEARVSDAIYMCLLLGKSAPPFTVTYTVLVLLLFVILFMVHYLSNTVQGMI